MTVRPSALLTASCCLLLALSIRAASTPAPAEILVTRQLAEDYGLEIGDILELALSPEASPAPFVIVGSYEPTPDPMLLTDSRHEVRLHLEDHLGLEPGPWDRPAGISGLRLGLAAGEEPVRFAAEIAPVIPGHFGELAEPDELRARPFLVLERFHYAIALVTVFGSSAFLLALMVMRAEERRETFGVLGLLGVARRRIVLAVLIEGLVIATCGSLFGVLFAAVTQGVVNRFFQWHYSTALVFVEITPGVALRCVALAVPLGVVAGILACWALLRQSLPSLIRR